MRIVDWSSDVFSSDLGRYAGVGRGYAPDGFSRRIRKCLRHPGLGRAGRRGRSPDLRVACLARGRRLEFTALRAVSSAVEHYLDMVGVTGSNPVPPTTRSEEHTSELQSLMRISYAVFCLKKKKK